MSVFKRIDHVEITTGDMERSIAFYVDVMGFKVQQRQKMEMPNSPLKEIAFLRLGDTMLELLEAAQPAPASSAPFQIGYRMMALEVEDMDKALEYLKGKGIEPSRRPASLGKSKRGEIKDPNGLSIELRQW